MKKCIVFQNECQWGDNIFSFPGCMKSGYIYALVARDSQEAEDEELRQIPPVAFTEKYCLYRMEEYLFATNCSREWYNILVYKADGRYGYVEMESGKVLTTPRFIDARPLYDSKDSALALDEFDQGWLIDREGNLKKTRRLL